MQIYQLGQAEPVMNDSVRARANAILDDTTSIIFFYVLENRNANHDKHYVICIYDTAETAETNNVGRFIIKAFWGWRNRTSYLDSQVKYATDNIEAAVHAVVRLHTFRTGHGYDRESNQLPSFTPGDNVAIEAGDHVRAVWEASRISIQESVSSPQIEDDSVEIDADLKQRVMDRIENDPSEEYLTQLLSTKWISHDDVVYAIMHSPEATPEVLGELLSILRESKSTDRPGLIYDPPAVELASNPNVPERYLKQIIIDSMLQGAEINPAIVFSVAANPSLSDEAYLNSAWLTINPPSGPEEKNTSLRHGLLSNPNIPIDILEEVLTSPPNLGQEFVSGNSKATDAMRNLFAVQKMGSMDSLVKSAIDKIRIVGTDSPEGLEEFRNVIYVIERADVAMSDLVSELFGIAFEDDGEMKRILFDDVSDHVFAFISMNPEERRQIEEHRDKHQEGDTEIDEMERSIFSSVSWYSVVKNEMKDLVK